MRRVVVIGVAGSGKSTVARALSERLDAPHIELDAIFWQPNWTKLDEDEFAARVAAATATGPWIADGNYSAEPFTASSPASNSGTATAKAASETNSAETPPNRSCSGPGGPIHPPNASTPKR
ncbi:AAA family ATPase [Kribbella sp. ALI-6-A]|uniref:AAA family ATPase n=1 Tax=Kribbella sp. ALI-6-A TaxID=1933817 RepID=UPI00117BBEEC|nr:AAA family ATPase [Kribbella sp. ALI-6-A]